MCREGEVEVETVEAEGSLLISAVEIVVAVVVVVVVHSAKTVTLEIPINYYYSGIVVLT